MEPPGDPAFEDLVLDVDALQGDLLRVDPGQNFADGARLPSRLCAGRHLLRFMAQGGAFDGTRLFLYMPTAGSDSVPVGVTAADEDGNPVSLGVEFSGGLRAVATNAYDLDQELGPGVPFGTLVIDCGERPCHVSAEYRAEGRFSAGIEAAPLDACP
jgi:hypothetical protein